MLVNIHISANFKKMAAKAILSIALFVITYLFLIAIGVCLTIGLGYAGIMLIILKPMFLTIMVGVGLMSVGVFVLIFLFKFVTQKHTADHSHLIEITAFQEPRFFEVIAEVVGEVKTTFPKKVYLSYEINAAVFYNSTFWSMFFPVRKNLQVGLGLINSVNTSELKAILAHEFGHFSQRSMKVGSYVYNVNQVIYNLLYENDSYNSLLGTWANVSNYFQIFAQLAVKLIGGIQWVLKKVYEVVNLSYMALSREMEFHADEVAANVTGPRPLITSLLRLEMADQSFKTVLNYYGARIENCVKTKNVYTQHGWLMNFIGAENNLSIEGGLVQVTKNDQTRFNKSKLVIKDQWSSHPTTEERIEYLQGLHVPQKDINHTLASTLLHNREALQEQFTEQLFKSIEYKHPPVVNADEQFFEEYQKQFEEGCFNKMYNGYYDNKYLGLTLKNIDLAGNLDPALSSSNLFNADAVDMVYTATSLENDIGLLKEIAKGESGIKTFDYDGKRYTLTDCDNLVTLLEDQLLSSKNKIADHDIEVCKYFLWHAKQQGKEHQLREKYEIFEKAYNEYNRRIALYTRMINETTFLQHTTPYETIEQSFALVKVIEDDLKAEIAILLEDAFHQVHITPEMMASFEQYLSNKKNYFTRPNYDDEVLDIMIKALANYQTVISSTLFAVKKSLLDYQAEVEMCVTHELLSSSLVS
jgi:Zn-dependent protease with chaperone function